MSGGKLPGSAVIAAVAAGAMLLAGQPAQGAPSYGQPAADDATVVAAAVDIAGIETAGPIPTVPGSGSREAELPPTVATVPGGNALHGDYPYLRVKDLEDAGAVTVRVYDASLGRGEIVKEEDKDFVWQGSLDQGWGQIGKRLTPGHGYVLWVRDVREDGEVRWLNFGRTHRPARSWRTCGRRVGGPGHGGRDVDVGVGVARRTGWRRARRPAIRRRQPSAGRRTNRMAPHGGDGLPVDGPGGVRV